MRFILALLQILTAYALTAQVTGLNIPVHSGEILNDTEGNPVNAHGAGILEHNGTYYLFGEIKKGKTWLVPGQSWEDYRVPAGGVSCYSSKDLVSWKNEGVALPSVTGDSSNDLDTSKVIERPKVVYNKLTNKFVMWMHIDANDYSYSQAGVAVSNQPQGPYTYLGSVKPNGQISRDMTLFKDEDERAYLVYASEFNKTMHVCLLSDDYISPTTTYSRITSAINREAPAVFKFQNKYWLITSDCTGWSPNPATYAVADSMLGEWKQMGNPCKGEGAETTFQSQSTFVLPTINDSVFIFMADRWIKTDLPDSRYIWLPLKMVNGEPEIRMPEGMNIHRDSAIQSKLYFSSKEITRVASGSKYNYQFIAADSAGKLLTYTVKDLPSWLRYDSVKHLLTGKTAKAGQYPIHIIAYNGKQQVSQRFMLTVYNSKTTNILCLGNSITNGTNKYNSYRRQLWQKLHAANYNFDMIGSWSKHHMGAEVPVADFDMDHEGHSGWTTADVLNPPDWDKQRGNIDYWLGLYRPDIVLIELGTNEVFQCYPVEAAMQNFSIIVDKLRKKNPSIKIFIAQVPPLGKEWAPKKLCGTDTAYEKTLILFNEAVLKLAKEKTTAASPIIAVDQFTGVDPATDMYDDIHPNDKGEAIMADRWYNALKPSLTKLK